MASSPAYPLDDATVTLAYPFVHHLSDVEGGLDPCDPCLGRLDGAWEPLAKREHPAIRFFFHAAYRRAVYGEGPEGGMVQRLHWRGGARYFHADLGGSEAGCVPLTLLPPQLWLFPAGLGMLLLPWTVGWEVEARSGDGAHPQRLVGSEVPDLAVVPRLVRAIRSITEPFTVACLREVSAESVEWSSLVEGSEAAGVPPVSFGQVEWRTCSSLPESQEEPCTAASIARELVGGGLAEVDEKGNPRILLERYMKAVIFAEVSTLALRDAAGLAAKDQPAPGYDGLSLGDRLLYEITTTSDLGAADAQTSEVAWLPDRDYLVTELMTTNRVGVWEYWSGLALRDTLGLLSFHRSMPLWRNASGQILHIYLLCLYQKLRLDAFVSLIQLPHNRESERRVRRVMDDFIRFRNDFWFSEITEDFQGKILYDKVQRGLGIPDDYEVVSREIADIYAYLVAQREHRTNRLLTFISYLALPITLSATLWKTADWTAVHPWRAVRGMVADPMAWFRDLPSLLHHRIPAFVVTTLVLYFLSLTLFVGARSVWIEHLTRSVARGFQRLRRRWR